MERNNYNTIKVFAITIIICSVISIICLFLPNLVIPGWYDNYSYNYYQLITILVMTLNPRGGEILVYFSWLVLSIGFILLIYGIYKYYSLRSKKEYYLAYERLAFFSFIGFIISAIIPLFLVMSFNQNDTSYYYISPSLGIGLLGQVAASLCGAFISFLCRRKLKEFSSVSFDQLVNEETKEPTSNPKVETPKVNEVKDNDEIKSKNIEERLKNKQDSVDEEKTENLLDE